MTETSAQAAHQGSESHAEPFSSESGTDVPGERQDGSDSQSGSKLHREAANYRIRAREAEQQRDALAQRVERMQRAEVERLAADAGLSHASDVFMMSGNELADYLTEDGDVDAEKVAADVAAIVAERPGLRKRMPGYDPTQGYGGRPPKAAPAEPSFADLFKSTNQPY
jgi:hypothetical protein